MLILAGAAAFLMTRGDAKSTRMYPDQWDSRIAPYVKITQKQRALYFKHPVTVRFLAPGAFEKTVTADEKELSKEDRTEIEQFTGLMRALGLITGDLDLFKASNDATGGGTLAYYSFEDERITVRGKTVTPAVRSTLVHELTHVLQDQHFAIGDRLEELHEESEDGKDTSEGSVFDAIIEGDANRVETLYRDSLTAKQRKALDTGRKDETTQAIERIKQVPKVVITMMTSPYTLGETWCRRWPPTVATPKSTSCSATRPRTSPHCSTPSKCWRATPTPSRSTYRSSGRREGVRLRRVRGADVVPDACGTTPAAGRARGRRRLGRRRLRRLRARRRHVRTDDLRRANERRHHADVLSVAALGRRRTRLARQVSRHGDGLRLESCDPGKTANVGKDASQDAVDSSPPGPTSASACCVEAHRRSTHAAWPGRWCGSSPCPCSSTRTRPETRPSRHGFNSSPPAAADDLHPLSSS